MSDTGGNRRDAIWGRLRKSLQSAKRAVGAGFLDDCGIADPRKVVHSLRHRAQDRLRAAGCPEDVRWF